MISSYTDTLLAGIALDATLQEVADQAARVIDAVDAAGAVVHRGDDVTRAASDPLADRVDAVQYRIGQGPCLHAFRTGRIVLLDLVGEDARWPDFQVAATDAGARTVLSLPLRLDDQGIGSLNLYSRRPEAFDAKDVRQAELFARPSALRLSYVGVAVHATEAAEVAGLELQDRATIEQAIGVLMGVHRDPSVENARRRLEQAAADLGVGVPAAAAHLVASPPDRGA